MENGTKIFYNNDRFIKRAFPWLLPGAIVILGVSIGIYIRFDNAVIGPVFFVIFSLMLIKYISIIYSFRYCIESIELYSNKNIIIINYTDFNLKKKIDCNISNIKVKAKLSAQDFKEKDKSGSILVIECDEKLIKTRINNDLFIKQYIDLVELLNLNIDREMYIKFKNIIKYLDDNMKERVQKIITNYLPPMPRATTSKRKPNKALL